METETKPTMTEVINHRSGSFPLSTDVLVEACDIFYGVDWKSYLVKSAKASVMMSILIGHVSPGVEFKNYWKVIQFLQKHTSPDNTTKE